MSNLKHWLGVVLALQLTLAAAFLWGQRADDGDTAQQPLLNFTAANVDKIVIQEDELTTTLLRENGIWQLPELEKVPASENEVQRLLEKLQALRTGWPVATTSSSHSRFQVAEDENQRRIALYQGDTLAAELLVGSSPGFRKVHLRRPGEDAVYTGELPTHELPAKPERWLNQDLIAAGDVSAIQGEGYTLEKQGEQWQFADGEAQVAADKAKTLVDAIAKLKVTGVASEVPAQAASTALQVKADGKPWTYTFLKKDGNHYVQRDDQSVTFTLAPHIYQRIADTDRAALTAPQAETETETQAKTEMDSEADKDAS